MSRFPIAQCGALLRTAQGTSLAAAACLMFATVQAQTVADTWIPNDSVRAMSVKGTTLYLGGDFTYVGPTSGAFAAVNPQTGAALTAPPKINGPVRAVVGDGAGGWFVGGTFTRAGNQTVTNLAHVRVDGTLDLGFNPAPNDTVTALAFAGGQLYVGGDFTFIGGQARNKLAQLSQSGAVTAWNPTLRFTNATDRVETLAADASIVYVGGELTGADAANSAGLVGLDARTAAVKFTTPRPAFLTYSLALDGTTLYVGTLALLANSSFERRVLAITRSTGAIRWDIPAFAQALALGGSTLYVGGSFLIASPAGSEGGGSTLRFTYALDAATGNLLNWDPAPDNAVEAISVAGSTVYLGGAFQRIGGQSRRNLAAVDAVTGALLAWNPVAGDAALAIATNANAIAVGGDFKSINGVERNFFAAIDLQTGRANSFNPNLNGSVVAMADTGSGIAIVGGFNRVGSATRNYLAEVNATTGAATAFVANADAGPFIDAVAFDGTNIYIGGTFRQLLIGTRPIDRAGLAAFARNNGRLTNWNPGSNGNIFTLLFANNLIYAGGQFTLVGGQPRGSIAAITTGGRIAAFNPSAEPLGRALVGEIAVSGSTVYFGGQFDTAGGQPRSSLAAANATSGQVTGWNPSGFGASQVDLIDAVLPLGNTVWVGGKIFGLGGQDRRHLAATDPVSGIVLPAKADIASVSAVVTSNRNFDEPRVRSLAATSDGKLVVGGGFDTIAGTDQFDIAIVAP